MLRFKDLLASGLRSRGMTVEVLAPRRILVGKNANHGKGLWKWLGYMDKWILFPLSLRRVVRKRQREFADSIRYHVCDHSNAYYLSHLPKDQTGITCHDVLAIRGALGYPDAYCAASRAGVVLQRWILNHLRTSQRIACVSRLTLRHLCEVTGETIPRPGWVTLHNALNAAFGKIDISEAISILKRQGIFVPRPFLLHVGSNLPRKNRRMLLQIIKQNSPPWPGHLCFAGEPVDGLLSKEAAELGILDRIHSVTNPNHRTLCSLYSLADALVFPSFSEGFGWPLIEAQACGTPVIASNVEPLPEISGGAALHADPHNEQAFASAVLTLKHAATRKSLIEGGFKNVGRFGLAPMIDKYLALHEWDYRSGNLAGV
jgi:glycosyltransferase involved in cell wall biosynthesis